MFRFALGDEPKLLSTADLVPWRTLSVNYNSSHYLLLLLADVQQEAPEHEQMLNIMSSSQRGRMDEQRCSLSPVKTGPIKTTPAGWEDRPKDTICIVCPFAY